MERRKNTHRLLTKVEYQLFYVGYHKMDVKNNLFFHVKNKLLIQLKIFHVGCL